MPLNLYEKESILDACVKVFAEHGYNAASTQKLAEAAQVSKALLFHHFKNKKQLYLTVLERCIRHYFETLDFQSVPDLGFFEIMEVYIPLKLNYCRENPDHYLIMQDAYYHTPDDVRQEVIRRFDKNSTGISARWYRSFEDVPLRSGVDRTQALELITMMIDGFEKRYVKEVQNNRNIEYLNAFVENFMKSMDIIRFGLED